MTRRKWDAKTKTQEVIERLRGRSVAEICNQYQIGQTQYYKWRDPFLADADRAFGADKASKREERIADENRRLKGMVGDLARVQAADLHLPRAAAAVHLGHRQAQHHPRPAITPIIPVGTSAFTGL